MKKFNEFGLPETGYDYNQHVAKGEAGEVNFYKFNKF
jgi:hypothetical protein